MALNIGKIHGIFNSFHKERTDLCWWGPAWSVIFTLGPKVYDKINRVKEEK